MKIPEIRIYYSWLLHENVSVTLNRQLNDGSWKMDEDPELLHTFAKNYQTEWNKQSKKILTALTEATGLEFYMPVIDVPCAHWFKAQSTPLTMSFYYYPDQFVDVLTHELCHVLLTDNNIIQLKTKGDSLEARWEKLFGKHKFNTLVHIPVHALCKYIYVDVLKNPSRLERDMEDVKSDKSYIDSWNYINSHDYKKIIADLKNDYARLAESL
jgi:hypothetical protein